MKVGVIGAGKFGTAVASVLALKGHDVTIVCRTETQSAAITSQRENNRYFPGYTLPQGVQATHHIDHILDSDIIFLAFPASMIDHYANILSERYKSGCVINLVKGIHPEHLLFSTLFSKIAPNIEYVALKGPTFAKPLLLGELSGFTCGASNPAVQQKIAELFRNSAVILDFCDSPGAVDLLSALKNVYAIAMGLGAAVGFSENTMYLMVGNIFKEINLILSGFNYSEQYVFKYCGIGDTLLTGMCDTSRNRTLGIMIGRGLHIDHTKSGFLAEGARVISILRSRLDTPETPILNSIYDVVVNEHDPLTLLRTLGSN